MANWLEKSMASTFSCQRKPKGEKKIYIYSAQFLYLETVAVGI